MSEDIKEFGKVKVMVCPTHGTYESESFFGGAIWSACPECTAVRDKQAAEEAERIKTEAWQARLRAAGVPLRYWNKGLGCYRADTPGKRAALDFSKSFCRSSKSGMSAIFTGNPGTGKTHLATGIMINFLLSGKDVLYLTAAGAVQMIKSAWQAERAESESALMARLVASDLLVLDEVGEQKGSEFERGLFFEALNGRYNECKPTILITNLAVREVTDFFGDKVIDRLREDGGRIIVFDWESERGK